MLGILFEWGRRNDNMKLTVDFSGRLGNILLEIVNTFAFAKEQGIPFTNVVFHKNFTASDGIHVNKDEPYRMHKNYLMTNKDIFIPMLCHLLNEENWNALLNSGEPIVKSPYGCSREVFSTKAWPGLLCSLFYDRSVFAKWRRRFKEYYSRPDETTALHIRRTDYAVWKGGQFLKSKEELQNCIDSCDCKHVVIFSDDMAWCKDNLSPGSHRLTFHPPQEPACADLILMSNFKKIIPAEQSSYSMFAAALSNDITINHRRVW